MIKRPIYLIVATLASRKSYISKIENFYADVQQSTLIRILKALDDGICLTMKIINK